MSSRTQAAARWPAGAQADDKVAKVLKASPALAKPLQPKNDLEPANQEPHDRRRVPR